MIIKTLKNNIILKNSIVSVLLKIAVSVMSFLTVPILLEMLGNEQYGVWVTLTSLLIWLQLTDFGANYSLKNRITESIANNEKKLAGVYFIGTFQIYIFIVLCFSLIYVILLSHMNILKTNMTVSILLYTPMILLLPLNLGASVIAGLRKVAILSSLSAVNQVIWLIFIWLNFKYNSGVELIELAIGFSLSSLISSLLIFLYAFKLLEIKFKSFLNLNNLKVSKDIFVVGTKFFIMQIITIILYNLGNYLNYNYLGPNEVSNYDTLNKFFMFAMSLFNVIISVIWPEMSYLVKQGNFNKAKILFKRLFYFSLLFSVITIIGSFLVPGIVRLWTDGKVLVTNKEALAFACMVSIQAITYSGSVVLNVFERLNGQILISGISAVLLFPIVNVFFKLNFNIVSVPLAVIIVNLPVLFYCLMKANSYLTVKKEST